jgi:FkbM family methyltransferase
MHTREIIKSALQTFGYDLVRYVPHFARPFDVLPLLVEEGVRRRGSFFFLQVGANDGALDDPIRDLVIKHDLKGVLVEPLPDMFEKLQQNYAGQTGLQFENVAISRQPGTIKIYRIAADADVPDPHWHGMASMSREHLLKHGATAAQIQVCEVPAVTMKSVLQKHDIRALDLLQIDTEGYDYEVLKLVLECGLRPRIVNYEHCHLIPKTRQAAQRQLVDLGYRFIEVGKDTVATLTEQS